MSARIRLCGLALGYAGDPIVQGLDGAFAPGEATAIVGPNGSGKSTLLRAVAGLIAPMAGSVEIDGVGRRQVAYLAQDGGVDRDFPISVADLVALGFTARLGLFGGLNPQRRARLDQALATVGLAGVERTPIAGLSGGQFQRALFARVMVQDASVILLDEPFAALDHRTAEALGAVVQAWAREGRTVLVALHDLDFARRLCGQALVFARGAVAWGASAEALTEAHLDRARSAAARWAAPEAA
jgi:zinc/manganese transport system ATP-binding protein